MRVMIGEADRALGAFLKKGLTLEGHTAVCCEDVTDLVQRCDDEQPQLIILSASMREEAGFGLLEKVKAACSKAALLVLTEECDTQSRVRCLDLGADDCLMKPFSFLELAARCRALLRRVSIKAEAIRHVAGLDLDLIDRKVRCGDKELPLTGTEFALLESLLRRNGACCSREELLQEVWQDSCTISTNVVDVYINYLRRKMKLIGAGIGRSPWIETVRGYGYRIRIPSSSCGVLLTGT